MCNKGKLPYNLARLKYKGIFQHMRIGKSHIDLTFLAVPLLHCNTFYSMLLFYKLAAKNREGITKTRLFKYIENFTSKNWKNWYFSNFCSKHRLWVPRRGGSNEYPQSMFLSRNKKINVYPCIPQFYYIKVGFKGGGWKLYRPVFVMIALMYRLIWAFDVRICSKVTILLATTQLPNIKRH